MNILYCGDSHMKPGLLISILSLLKETHEPLAIYILTAAMQSDTRQFEPLTVKTVAELDAIVKQANPASCVTRIDVTALVAAEPLTANRNTIFTPCCMLRLYADQVAQLPDKLLYLDTDVICRLNCQPFYHQDIREIELAGVLDHYGRWFFHQSWRHFDYMNSGMLLLNLKVIRRTGLFARCRELCRTEEMFMPDQSAINRLVTRKRLLPRRYNEQRRLKANTVFQHFTTSFRLFPWLHTLTVKPWQVEDVHRKLKLHEYDDILTDYQKLIVTL
ncbi:glycosyltransferase family 8 protein [Levilactobacillus hammesii]|uniref:Lipopolysaccharide biosynthesis glycosyltransferase n=1 Tax=Levilactobacillus hammesii DSM 16381 TaxID=1423753 RepID=A0A0R1UJB7_9LACO|nr:glycosyltransferase [Levilactobacillus hammesii]KRL93385.1 lipopolysaccharide biosynthesis glycosyltransferase [Levilactobacillus hammesii DSM 16381]